METWLSCAALAIVLLFPATAAAAELPQSKEFTNSLGMDFVRIESGQFTMGGPAEPLPENVAEKPWRTRGHFDEHPRHDVTISKPFYLGVCEVTNAQFEQFDPGHRELRGKMGFSKDDDEAVVFVSWEDAVRFCEWLSEKEGLPYRLPAEAEWEYACRAGTETPYWTGNAPPEGLPKNPGLSWFPDPERPKDSDKGIALHVGRGPANPWGLRDVHGNVEEWCSDWYGPYPPASQTGPAGPAGGDFRVSRGGSHSTEPFYLRSAARMGTLPADRSWLIGFRVALGEAPEPSTQLPQEQPLWARDVTQAVPGGIAEGPDPAVPYFAGPRKYVHIPADANGPMFAHHNHCPAVVNCLNGDLLAIWYSCWQEPGRELSILASRLRHGSDTWEPAAPFWDAPNRNDHASALWFDGEDRIYHFNGLAAAATWGSLALIMRTSDDNGATWSPARIIDPEHGLRNMPIESVFRTAEGAIVVPCDAVTTGAGGTSIHLSYDNGETWQEPGGKAAGIHAGIVQLAGGRLMALGRGDNVDGHMPMSLSSDMGETWTVQASPFQPIGGGQRLVLMRLREGPIFFASFARKPYPFTDSEGNRREATGLYCCLSHDDGETWTPMRPVTDDGRGRWIETTDGVPFIMNGHQGEPRGYMSVCQTADGLIQLITSRQHYTFNAAWVETPPPPPKPFLENGVTAHRGWSSAYPENTLPAFEEAFKLGVDWVELDVFKTKDGELAVIHDAATERVSGKDLSVSKTDYAELSRLDVAHGFRQARGLNETECPPLRIPLLSEVIRLCRDQRRARLSLQPKQDIVDECVALVRELDAEEWAGFNEGSLARVARVKELAPEMPVFWDRPAGSDIEKDIETARKHGFETIVIQHEGMTPDKVQALHAAGLAAGAWTVNDTERMRELLDMGVDRIYTDRPAALMDLKGVERADTTQ